MKRYNITDGLIWQAQQMQAHRVEDTQGATLLKAIAAAKQRPRDPRQSVRSTDEEANES